MQIKQWEIFELSLKGTKKGNPFLDIQFSATFKNNNRTIKISGFYDGNGIYKIRFMPDKKGTWTYSTRSNCKELSNVKNSFKCIAPSSDNHGPVRVRNKFHFAYEDGTPYFQIGTTCYAWIHQGDKLAEQTLKTLKQAPFNKIRMCLFPKNYSYNQNEPIYHAFENGPPKKGGNIKKFNPVYFQNLEKRIAQLCKLGIEADIIIFHPYDNGRWGYDSMSSATDERVLKYLIARTAAYRNVWWSLANEFDFMGAKKMEDWHTIFKIIRKNDPYKHLRSIHNGHKIYDHTKPWVTHCSIQHGDLYKVIEWRNKYNKPVIIDECGYEGSIELSWGNLTPQELINRFWLGYAQGGYVGHGETYLHPKDILWWSKGGVLYGKSPARLTFLKKIMQEGPENGIDPHNIWWSNRSCAGKKGEYYLYYIGNSQSARRGLDLPKNSKFKVDIIDAWNMTITPVKGIYKGRCSIKLPGKPYIAVRARKIK